MNPLKRVQASEPSRSRGGSVAGITRTQLGKGSSAFNNQTSVLAEYPLLDRLAEFDPASGLFEPITSTITNNTTTAKNVYVIAHGWMPGYLDWVKSHEATNLPVSWQTWQGPPPLPSDGPSTPWLFQEVNSTDPDL